MYVYKCMAHRTKKQNAYSKYEILIVVGTDKNMR